MDGKGKMSVKKKKTGYDVSRSGRPSDITAAVFVIYMLTVFACWMHNKYFDITGTRAEVFREGAGFFFIIFVMAFFFEKSLAAYYDVKLPVLHRDEPLFASPVLWMGLFTIANLAAFFMAPGKKAAWTGQEGRQFGLYMILMLFFMVLALTRGVRVPVWIFYIACLVAVAAVVMAVLQHFGHDVFHLRRDIKEGQQERFISFFGNLNTYASYLAMVIPFFWGVFALSDRKALRIPAGFCLTALALGVLPAKSDNIYIGLAAAGIFLLFISIRRGRILEWTGGAFLLSAGLFLMAVLNRKLKGSRKHLNGAAKLLENRKGMAALFLLLAVLTVLFYLLKKRRKGVYDALSGKKTVMAAALLLVLLFTGGFLYLRHTGSDLVRWNDKWGTYRGYIWRRGFSLFRDAGPMQKLFGYGNETVRGFMHDRYYEEMTKITKQVYDNLHNELLQYLVTTGLFGMIAYLGWFITAMRMLVRKGAVMLQSPAGDEAEIQRRDAGKKPANDAKKPLQKGAKKTPQKDAGAVCLALAAACAGYFAQGLVNLNQPITTPYFFFAAALGIGIIRGRENVEMDLEE